LKPTPGGWKRSWPPGVSISTPSGLHRLAAVHCHEAPDRSDILNVGGFSDGAFSVVATFFTEDAGRFLAEVEAIEL